MKSKREGGGGRTGNILAFFGAGGVSGLQKAGNQFTIIMQRHKNRKGYIIMGIMSTNVTTGTRYRGENGQKTIYFGGGKMISLHKISKENRRKVARKRLKVQKA